MKKVITTLALVIFACSVSAYAQTTYYVDATNGNDSNNGTSPATAWRTIAQVNSSWGQIQTSADLLFKRGEEFSGTRLKIERGGTEANPLIIGAYGSGDKPVISNASGGIRCWESNLEYIQIQDLFLRDIVDDQAISIIADGLSYITISSCEFDNMSRGAILVGKVNTYTIENCIISNAGNGGITIYGCEPKVTNGLIRNNIIYNILDNDGITLHINSSGEEVGPNHQLINNICFNCAEQGIDITSGSQIAIRNNETYNNGRGGIVIGDNVDDVWIDKHYSHDELAVGIILESSTNIKLTSSIIYNAASHSLTIGDTSGDGDPCENIEVYNNTIAHNNTTAVIDICSGTLNIDFKNNIITSQPTSAPGTFLRYLQGKTPSNTNSNFDNNIWWRPDGNTDLFSDSVMGSYNFSAWQSNYDQGAASMVIDPLLENIGNQDFYLQAGSQAINNGTNVGLTTDFEGTPIPQSNAPDIGAYEYSMSIPLDAEASASPYSGYATLEVDFTGSATGGTSPYSYAWNFGDGGSSTQQNPTHSFSQAGEYTVTLTVTDDNNNEAVDMLSISVTQQVQPLQVETDASPLYGTAPLTVNFSGIAEGGIEPYSFSWNFGDGGSSSLQNPSHTFSQPGTYTATFTVTDSTSAQKSDTVEITVNAPIVPLQAEANGTPVSGTEPLIVNFTAGASGGKAPYTYAWDFGDGDSSSEQNPSHTYTSSGNYSAVLTVSDAEDGFDTAAVEINVTASSSNVQLSMSAATGSPAPGWGGTTSPSPGSHDYTNGSTVEITAAPNENYRFSKWAGDISGPAAYENSLNLTMDQNKSIQANFYTKCGDVNGDLSVSPSDAQLVFEIFLGMLPDATEAQLENADVNTDGTSTTPNVTPADAQAIFEKFLGISELPGDCQCSSRADPQGGETTAYITMAPHIGAAIQIKDVKLVPGKEVIIPVIVTGPVDLKAFGFDLAFPSDILEYVGMQPVAMHKKLVMATGNQIADGVVRLGGFSQTPVSINTSKVMFKLVFKVKENASGQYNLDVLNKFDDFQYFSFLGGKLTVR